MTELRNKRFRPNTMNFERFRNEIFSTGIMSEGRLILSTEYAGNTKGKDNVLANDVEVSEYNSSKYIDYSRLQTVTLRSRYYLVLGYHRYADGKNTSEDIYVSVPNLIDFQSFFEEVAINIANDYDNIWTQDAVSPTYSNKQWISPKFSQGKQIQIIPSKMEMSIDNQPVLSDGIVIFIGSEANYVQMTATSFLSLAGQIKAITNIDTFMNNQKQDQILAHLISLEMKMVGDSTSENSYTSQQSSGFSGGGFTRSNSGFNRGQNNTPNFGRDTGKQSSGFSGGGFTRSNNQQSQSGFGGSTNSGTSTFKRKETSNRPTIDPETTVSNSPVTKEQVSLDELSNEIGSGSAMGSAILNAAKSVDSSVINKEISDADLDF